MDKEKKKYLKKHFKKVYESPEAKAIRKELKTESPNIDKLSALIMDKYKKFASDIDGL